jgi:hypothetical protein
MEAYPIRPSIILVVAIPVMLCEGLLALDHRSAEGTHAGLPVQDLRTKYRGCPQGSLSIMVVAVRLPWQIERVGAALDLDVALRWNRLVHPEGSGARSLDRCTAQMHPLDGGSNGE